MAAKYNKFSNCFEKLDNEGSGFLNLNNLTNMLNNYKDGMFKDQITEGKNRCTILLQYKNLTYFFNKKAIVIKKSQILLNGKPDENITKKEFIDLITMIVGSVDAPRFEDQIISYLQGTVMVFLLN